MARPLNDPELEEYQQRVGPKEYRRQYEKLYVAALQRTSRHSGKKYKNNKEKLNAIKEKYKNGVPQDIINKMVGL